MAVLIAALTVPWVGAEAHRGGGHGHHGDDGGKLLFFASDGLRQDAVEKYADEGVMPGFRELLRKGAYASGNGLLTQAPPNTGAGWFTLATGAWPAVHGSTNNTFHINGATFANSTSALPDHGQHPPGRDARAVGGARRQEGRADRVGRRAQRDDRRADARLPRSSAPAAAWRRTTSRRRTRRSSPRRSACSSTIPTASPAAPPFPAAAPRRATGWTERAALLQPRAGDAAARARRHRRQATYGLNAYIYDSRNDGRTRYDRVLFSRTKSGDDKVGDLREGEWADVKVTIDRRATDPLNGKTGAFLVKVERLAGDLRRSACSTRR